MKTLIFDYNSHIINEIRGYHIVVRFNNIISFWDNFASCQRHNHVDAFILNLSLSSLSQIVFEDKWKTINAPIILNLYNIGDLGSIFHNLNYLKDIEMRIFLSSSYDDNYYGLKILSSLGIDCGLYIDERKAINDELLEDLVSYYYMSPVPHAKIEPFDYISSRITDENNLSFNHVYYKDDSCFLTLDQNLKLYSSETGEYICELIEYDPEKEYERKLRNKMDNYYVHFFNLDECSKCSAFRICSGTMKDLLTNCVKTMNACLEDCLLFHHKQNIKTNDLCRH